MAAHHLDWRRHLRGDGRVGVAMTVSADWTPTGRSMCGCGAKSNHRGPCDCRYQIVWEHVTASGGVAWVAAKYAPTGRTPAASALPTQPTTNARTTDPDTSHAAALAVRRDRYAEVLAVLACGPASDFDLARATGIKQTSIGKRRGELRDWGLVAEHDQLGVSDTGSPCIRWTLTDLGRELAVAA